MGNISFSTSSKRRNIVEVAINYLNGNNRHDIENEIVFLNELTGLMTAGAQLHRHAKDPIVRPSIQTFDQDSYIGTINLKFYVNTQVESSEGGVAAFSYAGLHALLVGISNVCAVHRDKFKKFSANLNLHAMRAPWVLPVDGYGVILRKGNRQLNYTGKYLPAKAKDGGWKSEVSQMMVLGEPLAVKRFNVAWTYLCDEYAHLVKNDDNSRICRGPLINVDVMKDMWPDIRWGNIGVFVRVEDPAGEQYWEQLGSMHTPRTTEYILNVGNDMLSTPLAFDNTGVANRSNILLNDHDYYSFESGI